MRFILILSSGWWELLFIQTLFRMVGFLPHSTVISQSGQVAQEDAHVIQMSAVILRSFHQTMVLHHVSIKVLLQSILPMAPVLIPQRYTSNYDCFCTSDLICFVREILSFICCHLWKDKRLVDKCCFGLQRICILMKIWKFRTLFPWRGKIKEVDDLRHFSQKKKWIQVFYSTID